MEPKLLILRQGKRIRERLRSVTAPINDGETGVLASLTFPVISWGGWVMTGVLRTIRWPRFQQQHVVTFRVVQNRPRRTAILGGLLLHDPVLANRLKGITQVSDF